MEQYWIGSDIGGTNSNFSLIKTKDKKFKIILNKTYSTKDYNNIIDIINDFIQICLDKHNILPKNSLFAIAGQINKEKILTPNIKLKIDKNEIMKKTSLTQVEFINDFTAITYSILKLKKEQIKILNIGKTNKQNNKPILIIGAGTGLGKSIYLQKEDIIIESEGGHYDFSPKETLEYELCEFIKKNKQKQNIEIEDLVSGRGVENIYNFLSNKQLSAQEIFKLKNKDENCKKTVELFFKFYARSIKNFALDILASEIYIGGGIISKNSTFSKTKFMKEFTDNKKYKDYLKNIPIKIIKDYNSSIIGVGHYIVKKL